METASHPQKWQVIAGITFGLVFGGSLLAVWQDGRTNLTDYAETAREQTKKLDQRLTALEARLSSLESTPHIDNAALESIHADITALQTASTEVKEALSALEKRPVPTPESHKTEETNAPLAALTTAILSGQPYQAELAAWLKAHPNTKLPALKANAADGLATEASLREQFASIARRLNAGSAGDASASPLIARINTHLAGLVSIHKASDHRSAYASLSSNGDASLDQLAAKVDALPDDAQPPFADWRSTVKQRSETLAELHALPQDATP